MTIEGVHHDIPPEPIFLTSGDTMPRTEIEDANDNTGTAVDESVNDSNEADAQDIPDPKRNFSIHVNEAVNEDDIFNQIELFDSKLRDAEMQCFTDEAHLQMSENYFGLQRTEVEAAKTQNDIRQIQSEAAAEVAQMRKEMEQAMKSFEDKTINNQADPSDGIEIDCTAQKHESSASDTSDGESSISHDVPMATAREIKDDEFLTLDFPITININEINSTCDNSFFGPNNKGTARGSCAKNLIVRNKTLVTGKGLSKLTPEEEERVAKILREEDDALENYMLPSEEERTRETEIDRLLNDLGYFFDADDIARESSSSANANSRSEPVLRELAEKRSLQEREKRIDRALRALLREPLPRVIRLENAKNGEDGVSVLSSIGDSLLSAPISEYHIHELVQQVKLNLDEDNVPLADQDSVRLLATSILNEELAKSSLYSKP